MLSEFSLTQIKDPLHVRYVLGIKVPLNESLDLTDPIILKEVVEKQLLFENFLSSLQKYLGDSYDKIVSVIKSPFDIAILIKNLVTNPKLLESVLSTYKSKIDGYKKKFEESLLAISGDIKKIIEKIKSVPKETWQKTGVVVEKIITFYEAVVNKISKYFNATIDYINSKIGDGWLGLIKIIVSTGALGYVSDKINSYIKKITGITTALNDPKKFIDEIVKGEVKKNVDEVSTGLENSTKEVFDKVDTIKDSTVDSVMSYFKDILKDKNWLWKYIIGFLSKIADFVKDKIKTTGKGKVDLTHYGRLERDMKKIQDSHLRDLITKIITEQMNNSNKDNIYNKKLDMSKLNNLIKESIKNLLETKGFEDMEVAFGVKHKSDNLSDAEKNQFGPMGQLKTSEGGSFPNPEVPGTKEVKKANTQGGKDAQTYYKEVVKKIKDYQAPNDNEKFNAPKVDTNDTNEDDRLEITGYDVGISGMEVATDKAEKEGGSEATKKKYKERLDKLNGNDATYQKIKKNADKTNTLKYDKDARNTRPVKDQQSKQPEQPEKKNENIFKVNGKLVSEEQVINLANKVPSKIKIDETKFSITDGENTYKLIWEGDIETGEPVITNISNINLVNEDIEKMKYLWGFNPKVEKKIVKEEAEDTFKKLFRQVKSK